MKKFTVLIGCLILSSAFFFGCGSAGGFLGCGGETVEPIVSQKPWTNSSHYEYISYKLTRYDMKGAASVEDAATVAEGAYRTTLYTVAGNLYNDEAYTDILPSASEYFTEHFSSPANRQFSTVADTYSLLVTEYELTYNDKSSHNGKTDTMHSILLFKTSSLAPVFSQKTTVMQTAPNNSYTVVADYVNGKNFLTANDETVTTDITANTANFDNELLYYVIRAHSSLAAGGSSSVVVHNPTYTGLNNGEANRTIAFQVGTTNFSGIDPDKKFMPHYFEEGDVEYFPEDTVEETTPEDGGTAVKISKGYRLPAFGVIYQLNANDRGSAKTLIYSRSGFSYVGETTTKVLLGFSEFETDGDGNNVYATAGVIDDYKTTK